MTDELARPFDTIEDTQEFMALLQETIIEAVADVNRSLEATPPSEDRRAEALQLALYKMGQLSSHVQKSRRILNDLRTIRKLLTSNRWVEETVRSASA